MSTFLPVVAVAGSTGVGKSKLSIELASAIRDSLIPTPKPWNGSKIINADAMQVYKGLDLVTNKVTKTEMNDIPHCLFGFRELDEEYIVTEWVNDAVAEINDGHANDQLPVIVGGTSYWLQNLIFANRLASLRDPTEELYDLPADGALPLASLSPSQRKLFDNLPLRGDDVDETTAFELHTLLTHLDPVIAARWHWKDARKVLRSLSIIRESSGTVQATYEAQQSPVARYPTIIFWLYMDPSRLNPMLDSRINKMVHLGLKEEVEHMRTVLPNNDVKTQMTGLRQAIGYKEFDAYFGSPDRPQVEFERGVEQMKVATRQYATRQVKWIKSRLLPVVVASENVHIVLLEVKDPVEWESDVLQPALKSMEEFLSGRPPSPAGSTGLLHTFINELGISPPVSERRRIRCDICTTDPQKPVTLDERTEWDAHKRSRGHRRKENKDSRIEHQLKRQEAVRAQRAELRNDSTSKLASVGDGD